MPRIGFICKGIAGLYPFGSQPRSGKRQRYLAAAARQVEHGRLVRCNKRAPPVGQRIDAGVHSRLLRVAVTGPGIAVPPGRPARVACVLVAHARHFARRRRASSGSQRRPSNHRRPSPTSTHCHPISVGVHWRDTDLTAGEQQARTGGTSWLSSTPSSKAASSSTAPAAGATAPTSASRTASSPRSAASRSRGRRVLDATGMIVAPGYIDLHTHYDAQLFWDPYCTLSGWHGVTSVVIGNCGFGFAPVQPDFRERAMLTMVRTEAIPLASMNAGMPWDWVTFPEFLDSVERTAKAVNVKPFLPMNPVMIEVMGFERAKAGEMPTDDEHREMRRMLHEAMDAGAGGWSVQRLKPESGANVQRDFDGTPMATDVMHTETCIEFAEVLAERRQRLHPDDHGRRPRDPRRVDAAATRRWPACPGRPILYNVVVPDEREPERHRNTLKWLDDCRTQGPAGLRAGAHHARRAHVHVRGLEPLRRSRRMARGHARHARREARQDGRSSPPRRVARRPVFAATGPIKDMVVLSPKSSETSVWKDHTLQDIADATGKHPVDCMLDIAIADRLRTVFYAEPTYTSSKMLKDLLDYKYTHPGCQRRRCAHQVPDRRHLSDRVHHRRRAQARHPRSRGRALASQRSPVALRGLPRSGHARSGQSGRHRRVRLREPAPQPGRGRARPARRRVAARVAGRRAIATCSSTARSRSTTTKRPAPRPVSCCARADPRRDSCQRRRDDGRPLAFVDEASRARRGQNVAT